MVLLIATPAAVTHFLIEQLLRFRSFWRCLFLLAYEVGALLSNNM